jgi:hypothetical protein
MDWSNIRAKRLSPERPPEWPTDVKAISIEGLSLFGIEPSTNKLFWDGREIVLRDRVVTLGGLERFLIALAAVGTFGMFIVELGNVLNWWPT